ncbi:MAG TPA: GNAT family N-acetyltransferase [Edaphobacter sp.]
MVLQIAAEGDLAEIVDLANRAYRGTGASAGWTVETDFIEGERTSVPRLREELVAHPEALIMTWRDQSDGSLLGSVWLEPLEDGVWYLGLLSVRPELQGRQLGRRLLAAAEAAAKERGARRIRIFVLNVRDTLIAWYERRGYVLTGETKPFPYGDERVGRPLRDDLGLVMLEKAV